MSNLSDRIVPETTAATSLGIENQGQTKCAEKRNSWQRIRSAFCHCFENITDCFDFWFCKNECCKLCCTCEDYYDDDDENERSHTIRVLPASLRSEQDWETWSVKGIANEGLATDNEEFISMEIHQGDGEEGDNNSDKHSGLVENHSGDRESTWVQHNDLEGVIGRGDIEYQSGGLKESSGDQQSSEGQHNGHGACVIGDRGNAKNNDHGACVIGGGDAKNQSGGLKESNSGDQQSTGVQHNDHEGVIGGSGDAKNESGGLKECSGDELSSGGQHNDHGVKEFGGASHTGDHHTIIDRYTNHGVSYLGNDSADHHTSGGDYGVSDSGGGGSSDD